MISYTLPLSPTINHAYGARRGGGKFLRPAGVKFRKDVAEIVSEQGHPTLEGRLCMFVAIHPRDKRRIDLDNRIKALQDALTHAGVFLDDEQLDEIHIVRREVIKGGLMKVVITEIDGEVEASINGLIGAIHGNQT